MTERDIEQRLGRGSDWLPRFESGLAGDDLGWEEARELIALLGAPPEALRLRLIRGERLDDSGPRDPHRSSSREPSAWRRRAAARADELTRRWRVAQARPMVEVELDLAGRGKVIGEEEWPVAFNVTEANWNRGRPEGVTLVPQALCDAPHLALSTRLAPEQVVAEPGEASRGVEGPAQVHTVGELRLQCVWRCIAFDPEGSYNQMLWMSIPDKEAAYPPE